MVRAILISMLLTGCTFNFTINTDYASQNEGSGSILEEFTSENETEQTTEIETKLK